MPVLGPGLRGITRRIRAWLEAMPSFAPPAAMQMNLGGAQIAPDSSKNWPVSARKQGRTSTASCFVTEDRRSENGSGPAAVSEVRTGGLEILDELAEEWRELCEEGPCDEPFCRPEWVSAYLRVFAPRARVVLVSARVEGRLQAVLPLMEESGWLCGLPVKKLRAPANVHSVRFDMVRGGGAEGEAAVLAVWRKLRDLPEWDLIELPCTLEGGAHELLLRAAQRDGFPAESVLVWRSIYVPLAGAQGDGRPWTPGRKADFRSKLCRRRRQLEQAGPLAQWRNTEANPEALRAFFALEASGWKGRRDSAVACQPQLEQFYTEIAWAAARYGYFSLDGLESGGELVSAHFGMRYRGRYFLPKAAYNENYRRFGPGLLLVEAILRECQARGMREFDFTGPWAQDETQWSLKTRDQHFSYIFHRRVYGALLHGVRFRLRRAAKKLLRRESFIASPGPMDSAAS